MKPKKILKKTLLILFILILNFSCKNEPNKISTAINNNTIVTKDTLPLNIESIEEKEIIKPEIDSTKKYIYLTFDDGPYKGSKQINQIVKDENIKVTAFIVGLNAYTENLKQLIEDYKNNDLVELTNHTYSHANRNKFKQYYSNPNSLLEDVQKNETFYNLSNKYVRLPGRNTWRMGVLSKNDADKASRIASDLLADNNYYIMGWDYEWNKINKNHPLTDPEIIYNGINYRLNNNKTMKKNHLVLLMHDDMFDKDTDAEKLRELIKKLKNNPDIIFEFASNYPLE